MDFIKNFFKKYASLIVPVLVTVIAVVLFVPSVMISGSVQEDLKSSARIGEDVRRGIRSAVPVNQWAVEAQYQNAYEADANAIETVAKQTSMRDVLRYGIFPEPKVKSNQLYYEFGEMYLKAIKGLSEVMNAGEAPSEQTLSSLSGSSGGGSRGRNVRGGSVSVDTRDVIRDTACREKAARISVYANPETSFVGYDMWKEYEFVNQDSAIEDCWYSQVAYWIQEDIAKTIAKMNSGSGSVLTSKVKRLLGISFESSDAAAATSKGGDGGRVSYILEEDKVGLAPVWTGRTSSGEIDVIHFSVAVILDVKAEPEFYSELCGLKKHSFKGWEGELGEAFECFHNQITVLEHSLEPIDVKDAEHERYRYGDGTAVKLNLVCEYIFNRSYDKIKPAKIKEALGQEEEGGFDKDDDDDDKKSKKKGRRGRRKR